MQNKYSALHKYNTIIHSVISRKVKHAFYILQSIVIKTGGYLV